MSRRFESEFVSDWEYRVLDALSAGAVNVERIAARTGLSPANVENTLQLLTGRQPPFVVLGHMGVGRGPAGWEVTTEGFDVLLQKRHNTDFGGR